VLRASHNINEAFFTSGNPDVGEGSGTQRDAECFREQNA
jgi:hypothetical protein